MKNFVKIQKCDSHVVSGIGQSCLTLLEDIYLPTFGCDIIIMIPLLLLSMFDGKICSNGWWALPVISKSFEYGFPNLKLWKHFNRVANATFW